MEAALEQEQPEPGTQDCSHLVYQIYLNAGFEYPYASSFELYTGSEKFARVKYPRAGDLIVWPGHVGIISDPLQHGFYSLVSTGWEEQNYESPYWKLRGRPRFYRYRTGNGAVLSAVKTAMPSRVSVVRRQNVAGVVTDQRVPEENPEAKRPPMTVSERTSVVYGPPVPERLAKAAAPLAGPSSVLISTGKKPPTREEVVQAISELSDAAGAVLRTDDPLKIQLPVVVVDNFTVERVEVKKDHGWAQLSIDSRISIGGTPQPEHRETIPWELRRTKSGWEAVAPADRIYVPRDVAVKNLAAQLARLTASDDAAAHQEAVLRQEAELANLLSMLLASK